MTLQEEMLEALQEIQKVSTTVMANGEPITKISASWLADKIAPLISRAQAEKEAAPTMRSMDAAPKDGTVINLHVSWKVPCFWCPDLKRWVTTHQHTIDSVRDAKGWTPRIALKLTEPQS